MYRYNEIGGQVVVDSDWLVEDFGFAQGTVEHQVGDIFNSIDHTALAWSLKYYELSAAERGGKGLEYGAAIYANGDGYSFGDYNKADTSAPWQVTIPNAPSGYTRVAGIHTHPNIAGRDNENFSSTNDYGTLGGDYLWAKSNNLPLYLATPSGKVKRIEYTTKFTITTVYKNLNFNKNLKKGWSWLERIMIGI